MEVISIDIARAAQLFVQDEVKPRKGIYFPELVQSVKNRYDFVTAPDPAVKVEGGAKFAAGRFSVGDERVNIADLTIWNDAVVVEAPTTDAANIILDDFLPWLASELDFGSIPTKLPRSYVSGIVVQFAQTIDYAITTFGEFSSLLANTYNDTYNYRPQIAIDKVSFGQEGAIPKSVIGRDFVIERRVDTKHADNRFYTSSSFPTQTHIHLLQQFERLLQWRLA